MIDGFISCLQVGEVIHYDRKWVEEMVCNVAMADLRYSHGLEAHYDTVTINQQLSLYLMQGKAHLEAVCFHSPDAHLHLKHVIDKIHHCGWEAQSPIP